MWLCSLGFRSCQKDPARASERPRGRSDKTSVAVEDAREKVGGGSVATPLHCVHGFFA